MSQWYAIRSEGSVREGWRDLRKIKPEQHRLWWEESAKSTSRMLYLIRSNGAVVGIVRLDDRHAWMEVWIAVKMEHRQKGIATQVLSILSDHAIKNKWPPLGAVVSAKKNAASWHLFTRAGFVMGKEGFAQLIQPPPNRKKRR
jgi:L-amino acid N-acyltransferase YncA